ncbi:MAG TPA: alpha/beta hydrolase [Gammaproteobacteria bacterium]
MSYARYGRDDGLPAFYFHGLPGSRREGALLHRACMDTGVQLIAPDRPGYGLSSSATGARMRDWPAQIAELADRLGFARFHVFAVSGGGPYALACAASLPGRVRGTGICCGLGELADPVLRAGMRAHARFGFWLAGHNAFWLRHSYGAVTAIAARYMPRSAVAVMAAASVPADRAVLRQPPIRDLFAANLHEAFRQGAAGGVADMCAAILPWPFDPTGIRSLHLWHGCADRVVPWQHSEALARRVPAARLRYLDDEAHFSLPIHYARTVVETVLAD